MCMSSRHVMGTWWLRLFYIPLQTDHLLLRASWSVLFYSVAEGAFVSVSAFVSGSEVWRVLGLSESLAFLSVPTTEQEGDTDRLRFFVLDLGMVSLSSSELEEELEEELDDSESEIIERAASSCCGLLLTRFCITTSNSTTTHLMATSYRIVHCLK